MTAPKSPYKNNIKELKDYYWSYADILRDIGINESTYDQRIMAFMALKLLIDNNKLKFNFEYSDNFGFIEVSRTEWPKGSKQIDDVVGLEDSSAKQGFLKCGNIMIEFFEYSSPPSQPMDKNRPVNNHGHTHVCVDVTNIEEEYDRLVKNGVQFHAPPQDFGQVKATYGRDIDGNVFELQEIVDPDHPARVF